MDSRTSLCATLDCQQPVYVDPRNNISHTYCGRTHALAAKGQQLQPPHGICHECNLAGCRTSVAFDVSTGRVHDFCSLAHAQEAIQKGQWVSPQWLNLSKLKAGSVGGCRLPGCLLSVYTDGSTRTYDYCGRSHAVEHRQHRQLQAQQPVTAGSNSTSPFGRTTTRVPGATVSFPSAAPSKVPLPLCSCCQENNACIVLLPCGHICLCEKDADRMAQLQSPLKCPSCNQEVASRSKVFFNY